MPDKDKELLQVALDMISMEPVELRRWHKTVEVLPLERSLLVVLAK